MKISPDGTSSAKKNTYLIHPHIRYKRGRWLSQVRVYRIIHLFPQRF